MAQSACLYEPCFAVITRALGLDARPSITRITLIAGLASAIAFSAGATLAEALGWRGAVLAFAAMVAVVGAPLLFLGTVIVERDTIARARTAAVGDREAGVSRAVRQPRFWLIAAAFPMMALNHGMLVSHIVPLLVERGLGQAAAVSIASAIGPMQVAGRLALIVAGRRVRPLGLAMISFAGVLAAALILQAAGASPLLSLAFAMAQGAGYGLISIAKPAVTADMLGHRAFGSISGCLAVPYLACMALAPLLGALIWEWGGYDLVILHAAGMALVGMICMTWLALLRTRFGPADEG